MMSDAIRAERVRLIIAFRTVIVTRLDDINTRLKKSETDLCRTADRGFGPSDDEDDRRLIENRRNLQDAHAALQQQSRDCEWMWAQVETIFGANDVLLAMTEVWQKIGDLPFIQDTQ